MQEKDLQTHDIKTRIGMMIGTTGGEIHIAESVVKRTMDIRREAQEMLTIAISMNP